MCKIELGQEDILRFNTFVLISIETNDHYRKLYTCLCYTPLLTFNIFTRYHFINAHCFLNWLQGEFCFENDTLIEGGRKTCLNNGKGYKEVRQYHTDCHLLRFYFVTRCYSTYMESILSDLSKDPQPDVVIMNSCLWDISRYLY